MGYKKMWQETRDPACKMAVNLVSKAIRRMTGKRHLNGGKNVINTEFTPQPMWPIAKSLRKRDVPRASTAFYGVSGLKYHSPEKANAIADCLEIQFTPNNLCDENHEWWVEAKVQVLLETIDNSPIQRIRPCDITHSWS
jgi:hypothetical protein